MSFERFIGKLRQSSAEVLRLHGENDEQPSITDIIRAEEHIERHFSSNGWPHRSDDELYNPDIEMELERIRLEACVDEEPDLPPADEGWDDHDIHANNQHADALRLEAGLDYVIGRIRQLASSDGLRNEYARLSKRYPDDEL